MLVKRIINAELNGENYPLADIAAMSFNRRKKKRRFWVVSYITCLYVVLAKWNQDKIRGRVEKLSILI